VGFCLEADVSVWSNLGEMLLETFRVEEYRNGDTVLDGFLRSLLSGEKAFDAEVCEVFEDDLRLPS